MGNSVAKAKEESKQEKQQLDTLVKALENQLTAFELEIEAKRGDEAAKDTHEVQGGSSVQRVSEIRVSNDDEMDSQICGAVESFFQAATNSIDGDDNGAKKSAVDGAKSLVTAGLNALFGSSAGQAVTKRSFLVLFLNNSFCRVDYYAYSYNVNANVWGAKDSTSGVCYIADLSVLKTEHLSPNEIDFLLSQALSVGNTEFNKLAELKLALIQNAILSRALGNKSITFKELQAIAAEIVVSQKSIHDAFKSFDAYVSPLKLKEEHEEEGDPEQPAEFLN